MMRNVIVYHKYQYSKFNQLPTVIPISYEDYRRNKNQVEQEMKKMIGKCIEKRYAKLTDKLKQEFIIKVMQGGQTIRQASKDLCINYSSAKAIISNYRKSIGGGKQKYNLEPRQVKVNDKYDWKKFKILTYCEETQTNEYTMETFAQNIKKSNQDKVLI